MFRFVSRSIVILVLLGSWTNVNGGVVRTPVLVSEVQTINSELDGSNSVVIEVSTLPDLSEKRVDSAYLHLMLNCTRVVDSDRAQDVVSLAVLPHSRGSRVEGVVPEFELRLLPGSASPVMIDVTDMVKTWASG